MELVEGPTLADRIAQGAIPVDEARCSETDGLKSPSSRPELFRLARAISAQELIEEVDERSEAFRLLEEVSAVPSDRPLLVFRE